MKKKSIITISFFIIFNLFIGHTQAKQSLSSLFANSNSTSEQYQQALAAIKEKHYPRAIGILKDLGDYKNSTSLLEQLRYLINGSYIGNGIWAVGAITSDSGVQVACDDDVKNKYTKAESWKNIKAISFRGGESVEGLTEAGRIITTHTRIKEELLSAPELANVVESVSTWSNIKSFQTFYPQTAVALTNDGFVYASYPKYQDGTVKLKNWNNIAAVADGRAYVAGLKEDGTVIYNVYDYAGILNTSNWNDIVAISASSSFIELKEDGTVVATGINSNGTGDVSGWKDIIAVSTSELCTLGLKRDGTVVAAGSNDFGQMNVNDWKDIVAISAGFYFSIGLKADGTIVLAGNSSLSSAKTPNVSGMKGSFIPQINVNEE